MASWAEPVPHVLTIDLEDWFHCLEPDPDRWCGFQRRAEYATGRLLEVLAAHDATATFFVLGDVARSTPGLVREVARCGHEIGTHGQRHHPVYRQSPAEFRADVCESRDRLEAIVGAPVRSYRAPYFSITAESLWALDILAEIGLEHDSSIFPIRNPRYGIPDARRTPHYIRPGLCEWPLSTLPTPFGNLPFCGGFYFRLLPWRLIRHGVCALERRREPIIVYLHPWELDPEQPRHRTPSRFLNFRHYLGLHHTATKLTRLLRMARYRSLAAVTAPPRPRVGP